MFRNSSRAPKDKKKTNKRQLINPVLHAIRLTNTRYCVVAGNLKEIAKLINLSE